MRCGLSLGQLNTHFSAAGNLHAITGVLQSAAHNIGHHRVEYSMIKIVTPESGRSLGVNDVIGLGGMVISP